MCIRVRQIEQLAFYPHCPVQVLMLTIIGRYLGVQNYTEYGLFCTQIAKPIHIDLWQYMVVSPVWESILTFRTAQLYTHKDLRFRKVPEYTVKHHVFYLSKLDITIKSVYGTKQTMLYFSINFQRIQINEHTG